MNTKICRKCNIEKPVDEFHIYEYKFGIYYRSYCIICYRLISKERNRNFKLKVINHYSNDKNECACCGEAEIKFLSLDHINNGRTNPPIRAWGSGDTLYKKLIHANFPVGYQVLCFNCNLSKGFWNQCPHPSNIDGRDEMYNLYG